MDMLFAIGRLKVEMWVRKVNNYSEQMDDEIATRTLHIIWESLIILNYT